MNVKENSRSDVLLDKEIDRVVEAQAHDDEAWEEAIEVSGKKEEAALSIPSDLAKRASFIAKLHKASGAEEWLTRIIKERVELEESAYVEIKRGLEPPHRA